MQENTEQQSLCIGITGGFGSGKTTVANIIRDEGFNVIFTDALAKDIMTSNHSVRTKIIKEFGEDSFNPDSSLNSSYLASIVFSGTDESRAALNKLNSIVHPPVIDEMIHLVDEFESNGEKLIFVESALIFEAELEDGFDYIINVNASTDKIFQRATERGMPESFVENRILEQLPAEKKSNWADFNIDNNSGIDELRNSTLTLLEIIKAMV